MNQYRIQFYRIAFLAVTLALSASAYVVVPPQKSALSAGCGCIRGLFQDVDVKQIQVTPVDVSNLVLGQINEAALRKFITEAVPSSNDIKVLYSQPELDSKFAIIM